MVSELTAQINNLIKRLDKCPAGQDGWREFEDVCIDILCFLFVPPLRPPRIQTHTYSGTERRDAVFPNRNDVTQDYWGFLFRQYSAALILVEFKNYDATEIGSDEVNQTRNYLREHMGRLAILVCNKRPHASAYRTRNTIFGTSEKKVILFVTTEHLKEMLQIKERGGDPSDLLADLVDEFLLQHE
jgi:hypothetical protein